MQLNSVHCADPSNVPGWWERAFLLYDHSEGVTQWKTHYHLSTQHQQQQVQQNLIDILYLGDVCLHARKKKKNMTIYIPFFFYYY